MPSVARCFHLALRCLAALLLVLLLGLGGTYLYLKANTTTIAQELLDYLTAETGLAFSVGQVGVDLLPLPALNVADGSISGKGLTYSTAYTSMRPDIAALLRGEFVPSSLHIVRPRLRFAPDQADATVDDGAQPHFDASTLRTFWPEGCKLRIDDGHADVTLADGTHVALANLDCQLKNGDSPLQTRGLLFVGKMLVERPGMPAVHFSGVRCNSEQSLFSLRPGEPHIQLAFEAQSPAWLDKSRVALEFSGTTQQWRLAASLDGNFLKDGTPLPFTYNGTFALAPHDGVPGLAIENTRFSLGRDSATLNGTVRLPSTPARLLDEAAIEGELQVERISLTEWLGFGRLLPAGLQNTLDTVSNATLRFSLDGKGLRVPHIVASCQGSTFTGMGGVESWKAPVVFLDLLAPQVNLGVAIPEAVAILPSEPQYGHGPLTPEGTPPTPEELQARANGTAEPGITVGYDIRLGAETVNYGPLVINNARVRIHPGPEDKAGNSDTLLDATANLYKGSFKGSLALGWQEWLPYTITVSAADVDGKGIAHDLTVLPFSGGTWQGEARVTSKGRDLDVFLSSLRGTARVDGRRGGLPIPLPGHDTTRLSLDLGGGKWKDNHLGLTGKWQGTLAGNGLRLAGETNGYVWFGEQSKNRGVVDFEQLKSWLRLETENGALGLPRETNARMEGVFSLRPQQVEIRDAHVQAWGASARGNWLLAQDRDTVTMQGPLTLDVPQLRTTLASLGVNNAPPFLQSLHGKAEARITAEQFSLDKLQCKVGHTTMTGTLSGHVAKKQLAANLTLDTVDIDRYFPVAAKTKTAKTPDAPRQDSPRLIAASDEEKQKKVPPAKPAAKPATSLDFSVVKPWSAQGNMKVNTLLCRKVRLNNVRFPFVLRNGRLDVASVDAQAYGGPVKASGHVLFDKSLGLKGKAQATNVNLAPAMRERQMHMQGTGEIYADLAATLATTADWPKALGGTWRFAIHNGQFQNSDKNGAPKGKPTAFTLAQASGDIVAGVVRGKDIMLRGPGMDIRGNGNLDLPRESIDCNFDVNMTGMPDFPMRLYGNLDNPKTSIGAATLILNALGGLGSGLLDTVGGLFTGIGKIFTPQANR